MRFTCVALAIITWCCWSAFAQELPLRMSPFADSETAELKQQVSILIDRIERLESQLAQMNRIAATIGLSHFDEFGQVGTDNEEDQMRTFLSFDQMGQSIFNRELEVPAETSFNGGRRIRITASHERPKGAGSAERTLLFHTGGTDEGMMIDAIQHKVRQRQQSTLQRLR